MKPRNWFLSKTFYDQKRFRHSFSRSGIFSVKQSKLLESYGCLIKGLLKEEVSDPTPDDIKLRRAILSHNYTANPLADVWLKYSNYKRNICTITERPKEQNEKGSEVKNVDKKETESVLEFRSLDKPNNQQECEVTDFPEIDEEAVEPAILQAH